MAPPPPPPPGPPPPPMMAAFAPPMGSGAQPRDQLLSAIRQGTRLKKTKTIDKSAPLIAGKTLGSGVETNREGSTVSRNNGTSAMNGATQPLAGLFAGGMPKLRPTGLGASPGKEGSLKATQSAESKPVNRGPPPQPPPASQKPSSISNAPELNGGSRPVVPNKPPVGGYGKPNLAPRPPPPATPNLSALHANVAPPPDKPSPPPKKLLVNGRPTVSRAQSMRAPRTPPVGPPITNAPSLVSHLSQDGLNVSRTGTLPHNFHGHKMAPSPPGYRGPRPPGIRPPPPPSRPAPPTTAPPPPPPHRTSPAPPPPRMPPPAPAPNSAPPAPPARNSSMRNGSTTSLMSELEARFAFHNVREFPDPQPYRNVAKQYNTRIAVNGGDFSEDDLD